MSDKGKEHWIYQWGLDSTSSKEEITRAWRRRAQALHPDKVGNGLKSQDMFCQLQEQYGILKDDEKRNALFKSLDSKRANEDIKPSPPPSHINTHYIPCSDIEHLVKIELNQAKDGGWFETEIKKARPCGCNRQWNCLVCKNVGQVFELVRVEFYIHPGFPSKGYITIDGEGDQGSHENGDLIIQVLFSNKYGWEFDGNKMMAQKKMPLFILKNKKMWVRSPHGEIKKVIIYEDGEGWSGEFENDEFLNDGYPEFFTLSIKKCKVWMGWFIYIKQKYLQLIYNLKLINKK